MASSSSSENADPVSDSALNAMSVDCEEDRVASSGSSADEIDDSLCRQDTAASIDSVLLFKMPSLTDSDSLDLCIDTSSPAQDRFETSDTVNSEPCSSGNATPCRHVRNLNRRDVESPILFSHSPVSHVGSRFKLLHEGNIQVCRLNHTRTIISKIMNSKYLRRWESHRLVLKNSEIQSYTAFGFMESPIKYSSIEDVNVISRWDSGQQFCIRVTVSDGSLLLQAKNSYVRDQWLHSIQWKRCMLKYEKILKNTTRPDILIKEVKNMVDMSLSIPIQDVSVFHFPLDLVSQLFMQQGNIEFDRQLHEEVIVALGPLLERNHPTPEICAFFTKHCRDCPRSEVVIQMFLPVIHRILKHNMDFGKYPRMRTFVQEFIQALRAQNDGLSVIQNFIKSIHGQCSSCPHLRILPNVVAVCLASIYTCYEDRKRFLAMVNNPNQSLDLQEIDDKLVTYVVILHALSSFPDWLPCLSSLLQPIPFPDEALAHPLFTRNMRSVLTSISSDERCSIHQTVLGIRENKEGWFDLYCPGEIACDDDGELYGIMLQSLMRCCCRRKKFLQSKSKMIGPWQLLALRENEAAMEALCAALEYEICESDDLKMHIITTLQTTSFGKKKYAEVCERQIQLRELQQKGGPRKIMLPSRSTDADVAKLLSSGSFGNLECLSLAFTHVTSACAHELIKLPLLRYLNLWSTQFGDAGLLLISEHLHKLEVLNLCETPVTDRGLLCLAALKNLKILNLNSTYLSALAFEALKEKLPALKECDVRYTDAW